MPPAPRLLPLCLILLGAAPGIGADTGSDERTAVIVTLERRELPGIEAMQGWFLAGGEPLQVLRVEKGPAEVLVVRDPAAQAYLRQLSGAVLDREILRARKFRGRPPGRPLERGPVHVQVGDTVLEVGTFVRLPRGLTRGEVDMRLPYGMGRYPGLDVRPLLAEQVFPVCAPTVLNEAPERRLGLGSRPRR